MASAINCDRYQKKSVKDEVAHVRINSMYSDTNNWSPAHIYHEISGYTKLSDINRKGNLTYCIIILNVFMVPCDGYLVDTIINQTKSHVSYTASNLENRPFLKNIHS